MNKKSPSKLLVALIVVASVFVLIGVFDLVKRGSAYSGSIFDSSKKTAEPEKGSTDIKQGAPVYSFYKDDDRDGLVNGWEEVFGSDPSKQDTDGDDYSDYEEVQNGYDPIVAGDGRLEERKSENLSIDYYLWARERGIEEPTPEDNEKVERFAKEKNLLNLKQISDSEIQIESDNSRESIRDYFAELGRINIPRAAFNYQSLASGYTGKDEVSKTQLQDLLSRVELAMSDLRSMSVPTKAVSIHKKHLMILKNFHVFLQDLEKAKQDPVRIETNLLKAGDLIKIAFEAEKEANNLLSQ